MRKRERRNDDAAGRSAGQGMGDQPPEDPERDGVGDPSGNRALSEEAVHPGTYRLRALGR
jgi:hypothetical protein